MVHHHFHYSRVSINQHPLGAAHGAGLSRVLVQRWSNFILYGQPNPVQRAGLTKMHTKETNRDKGRAVHEVELNVPRHRMRAGVSPPEGIPNRNGPFGHPTAAYSPSTATVTVKRIDLNLMAKASKSPGVTVEVPRTLLASRSPGSKPNLLLMHLEAKQRRKHKLKGRSPGGAVHYPKAKEPKKQPDSESQSSAPKQEPEKPADSPQFKSAMMPLMPPPPEGAAAELPPPPPPPKPKTSETKAHSSKSQSGGGLTVDPTEAEYTAEGGMNTLMLLNESNVRFAIKIKTSNNQFYRVNPVYSFLDSGAMNELEVYRLSGGTKKSDKLLICYVVAKDDDINAKSLFNLRAKIENLYIKLKVV